MSSASAAEIPAGMMTIINNIKEIVCGDVPDGEVFDVLRDCGMDPNAAVEKLLLRDPFQEVKRKKDKKKENARTKVLVEARSTAPGRGSKASSATYARRNVTNYAGGKNNGTNRAAEKATTAASRPKLQQSTNKETNASSFVAIVDNNPPNVPSGSTGVEGAAPPSSSVLKKDSKEVSVAEDVPVQPTPTSDCSESKAPISASEVCLSPLDPVLIPSEETRVPGKVGAIRREVGSRGSPAEPYAKATKASEGNSSKKWKTKATNPSVAQGSASAGSSASAVVLVDSGDQPQPTSSVPNPGDETPKLKKLEKLQLPQRLQVIIPSHIRVPESERLGLTFGSFGAGFQPSSDIIAVPEIEIVKYSMNK